MTSTTKRTPVGVVPPPLPPPVVVGEPDLGGYFNPEDAQDPFWGASMGTNCPSKREPFKLKYQLIWLRLVPSQSSDGVKPDAVLRADVMAEREYVLLVDGVMPAEASQS